MQALSCVLQILHCVLLMHVFIASEMYVYSEAHVTVQGSNDQ